MEIRPMTPQDWPRVARIFAQGVEDGNATFHPHVPAYEEWDAQREKQPRLVILSGGRVVGWSALTAVSPRPCYRGVKELAIYIERDHRGRGVGKALLAAMIKTCEAMGIWTLESHIFAENAASIALHKALGFRLVGRRRRLAADKDGKWHDVVLMERRSRTVEWEED